MRDPFFQKIVLITGGTGSFGRTFIKRLLGAHQPKKVIVLSRDEWKQWEMQQEGGVFEDARMRYFIGDVRDRDRLTRAFDGVQVVIHAAALKQVPAAEYNPEEFVKTNIIGAQNVIDASIECGVEKVIALSTDKAVNPINLYGATKLCAEKLFSAAKSYVGARGHPLFSIVRYGNVLMSRGSVIALWKKHLADGGREIPLTDSSMTRFWLTLNQAVDFTVQCVRECQGGEIFVPRIPSMRLLDILLTIAPGARTKSVGLRDGEKRHETLLSSEEAPKAAAWNSHFCIYGRDTQARLADAKRRGAQVLDEGFSYTSENNGHWLTPEDCARLLEKSL